MAYRESAPAAALSDQQFGAWLNSYRASVGLPPVAYDPALANAAVNSAEQAKRGMGHHFMGPARRQNAAWSPTGFANVPGMWAANPGHNAALLDPTIRFFGLAGFGANWTFSAY